MLTGELFLPRAVDQVDDAGHLVHLLETQPGSGIQAGNARAVGPCPMGGGTGRD